MGVWPPSRAFYRNETPNLRLTRLKRAVASAFATPRYHPADSGISGRLAFDGRGLAPDRQRQYRLPSTTSHTNNQKNTGKKWADARHARHASPRSSQ